jgi:hypothetical protein
VQHGNSSVTLKRVQRGNWPFTLKGVAWQFVSHIKGCRAEIGLSLEMTTLCLDDPEQGAEEYIWTYEGGNRMRAKKTT